MTAARTTDRPSKGAMRYRAWLATDQQTPFGEWLKSGEPEPDNGCTSCQGTGIGNPRVEGSNCWACNGRGYIKPEKEWDV